MIHLLKKLVPRKIKRRLRAEFKKFLSEDYETIIQYYNCYLPYQKDSHAYLVTRDGLSNRASPSEFEVPPEGLCLVYAESVKDFLESGQRLVKSMRQILKESGFVFEPGSRILDFGCGAGRMIRWLKDVASLSEIWGVDIRMESILWCQQNLSPPFKFATITTTPHLPFEDRTFDLICAGSVFTHIDDLADAWFLELRRVLKPGGLLYVTIHDQHTLGLLKGKMSETHLAKSLERHSEWAEYPRHGFEMFTIGRAVNSQVFYDLNSLSKRLENLLYQVVSVTKEAYEYQTALLLRKGG